MGSNPKVARVGSVSFSWRDCLDWTVSMEVVGAIECLVAYGYYQGIKRSD